MTKTTRGGEKTEWETGHERQGMSKSRVGKTKLNYVLGTYIDKAGGVRKKGKKKNHKKEKVVWGAEGKGRAWDAAERPPSMRPGSSKKVRRLNQGRPQLAKRLVAWYDAK